jgi:hypothetical protein
MKKSIWILGLCLVSLFIFGLNVHAQSNEVTESVTTSFYATPKILPLGPGQDRGYMTWENLGVVVSDTVGGLFNGVTVRCVGANFWEKGSFEGKGYCAYTLKDGEKVFSSVQYGGKVGMPMPPAQGTATIIGGTGKYSGIEGRVEFTSYTLRPSVEGIGQNLNKGKITYKLP